MGRINEVQEILKLNVLGAVQLYCRMVTVHIR